MDTHLFLGLKKKLREKAGVEYASVKFSSRQDVKVTRSFFIVDCCFEHRLIQSKVTVTCSPLRNNRTPPVQRIDPKC